MILACQNITKVYDGKTILQNASFHIEEHEKAALIGINGVGKTTMLNIITGRITPDEGCVSLTRGKTIGYLEQHPVMDSNNTIYEELLSVKAYLFDMEKRLRSMEKDMKLFSGEELTALMNRYASLSGEYERENGYACQSEITGVLKGLGFQEEEFGKMVNTLSGGQKTRVALGKILLLGPDIILLDEPTNHLDMNAISWLENYLVNYSGAVLVVSHDRYFLNRISQKVIEIDQTCVQSFQGNYSDYAMKKEQLRITRLNAFLNQQRDIRHQQQVIDKLKSFNREKSIRRAESREKMLSKIAVLDKPSEAKTDMELLLSPRVISGNDVLSVKELSKSFDRNVLFDDLSFQCRRGEHIAIIGDNGTGKTTILKIINKILAPDKGEVQLGSQVSIGYYDQEHHVLHMEKSIYDEIADDYPSLTITEIRNVLAAFLFTGDDVFKLIQECSGGERGRISLAKLMLSEANFLILDEPTNHLDIESKEILENALNQYDGTILYVSHDRYFINRTAHRILELSDHKIVNYLGNYDYYLEKKADAAAHQKSADEGSDLNNSKEDSDFSDSENKMDWKLQKEEQAKLRKNQNDLKKTEEKIEQLEKRDQEIEQEMTLDSVCRDVSKLSKLTSEQEALQKELTLLYEKWEELSENV
jgi:ATP-binding cassette subfamily F protein 3